MCDFAVRRSFSPVLSFLPVRMEPADINVCEDDAVLHQPS